MTRRALESQNSDTSNVTANSVDVAIAPFSIGAVGAATMRPCEQVVRIYRKGRWKDVTRSVQDHRLAYQQGGLTVSGTLWSSRRTSMACIVKARAG